MALQDPGWWGEVSDLLDEGLELPADERDPWLAAIRSSRPEVADRIAQLLAQHDDLARDRFLEQGPATVPGTGLQVGSYTLRRQIGEGGMGSVWLAERTDGEVRQQAAVKLLGGIAPGPMWRDRFLRERQVLATLSHPSIVRMLDAGHTADGRPFLVMEYVDGEPIDVHAEALPVAARLEVFARVCDAVAYAHHRLIVHRDLKPSNILVDAAGVPKLLDFGIAKLLDDSTDATQTADRFLTPGYASPEQFSGAPQTTATDVYSLGAVLYKLLTGRSPHEWAGTGRSSMAAAAGAHTIPAASAVRPEVPEDVDYILRKALRREPDDRYVSVDALAADIRRVLNAEPVEARAGDGWYRARTFTRRNRVPLAAGATVLASLTGALIVTNRERAVAERRFQQVRELANRFIALDGEIRALPGSIQARTKIVTESLAYLASLGADASDDLDLAFEIGTAYMQVARVQGSPAAANLGRYEDAEQTLTKADAFLARVLAKRPRHRGALLVGAQVARDRMALLDYSDRRAEALPFAERAAALAGRLVRAGRLSDDEINNLTHVYANLGVFFWNTNRLEEVIRYTGIGARISEGVAAARMRRASALGVLSTALRRTGELEEASKAAHAATVETGAVARDGAPDQTFNLSLAYGREAQTLCDEGASLGRLQDGCDLYERARALTLAARTQNPEDFRFSSRLAILDREYGATLLASDPQRSLELFDEGLSAVRPVANARAKRETAALLAYSSHALRRLGRGDEALARIDEALSLLRETGQLARDAFEPGGEVDHVVNALGEHYIATGYARGAIDVLERLRAGVERWELSVSTDLRDAASLSRIWTALERAYAADGQRDRAREYRGQRRALWSEWVRRQPRNVYARRQLAEAS